MPGGRTAEGVDGAGSIPCCPPEWLVWEERCGTCEDLACQAKGQESCPAAGGRRGRGLSLGVAVPSEVGMLAGGQGPPVPPLAPRLCCFSGGHIQKVTY